MQLENIRLRDPFILASRRDGKYYLYGTGGGKNVFVCYVGDGLDSWSEPHVVFKPETDFWADRDFWAPEVYFCNGAYFMFASFKSADRCRGTQILAAESPLGPFVPLTKHPVTPAAWECLDGSLCFDDNAAPWLVFVHEYCDMPDGVGTIEAMPLSYDLRCAMGEPRTLFRATDAPQVRPISAGGFQASAYITDGPFLYRDGGKLRMLWSSFGEGGRYMQCLAESATGSINGPWIQLNPVYVDDGGHGMRFEAFTKEKYLILHTPNSKPEHPRLLKVDR